MKGLCNSLASPNPDLAMVAETFVDLQKKRHIADYDNATVWTRIQVEKFIEDAKVAFEAWARIKSHAEAQDFLLSLFVPERR